METLKHTANRYCIEYDEAGEQGFEPQLSDPESDVLPLDYSPIVRAWRDG